jgi:tetratricopeptide (TPR) repeat protein
LVACKRASELRPGDATTWYLMGLAYNQLGDYEKELKAYDTALKIQPRMEAALLNKGATLFQLHRYDWALKVYEDMCNFFPKDAMAFNNRGIVLKALGRSKEALESFDKASFLNQKYIDPVVNRALTLDAMGRNGEAIEAWTEALQIDRERADIWYSLGISQKAAGKLEGATISFENAVILDKGMTEAITERDELLAAAIMVTPTSEQHPAEAPQPIQESETQPVPESAPTAVARPEPTSEPEKVESAPAPLEMVVLQEGQLPEPETLKIEAQEPSPIPGSEALVEEVLFPEIAEPEVIEQESPAIEVKEEAQEPAPVPEPESKAEETVPVLEAIQAEVYDIEAASIGDYSEAIQPEASDLHAEEPPPEVTEVNGSVLTTVEPCSLVPTEMETALQVNESCCTEIQNVGAATSMAMVEPPGVPAIRDGECRMAVQAERELPSVVNQESAVMAIPEDLSLPAKVELKSEAQPTPSIELPVAEVVPEIVPSALPAEAMPTMAEPVYEAPLEPEIPISDRELKAAVILNILGENDRALEEIDRYIRDKSGSLDARHVKANILDDLGRLPECLAELTEAIRLDPKDEIALMDIESISRRVGRRDESMRILASIEPSKEVKAREAVGLLEAKRYDEIISKYSNLGPLDSLLTRMAVATSLMAKTRYRDAYRVLKELLLEHPAYPEALNNMGVCMRFMGEYGYDEPMHFMHLAVEADPNYGDAWNNIGATLFVIGDYNKAMEAIRKAVAVDRRADYLINLSKCQIMVGDIAGAELSLTSALKYEETAEIDFALGLIAEKEGDMRWALKLYESAIELHPNFKDAIFNKQRVRLFLKYTQK